MMKNRIFLLLAACLFCIGQAVAGNVLTVSDVDVPQGGRATVEVGCAFEKEYTAFELELTLPDGFALLADEDGNPVAEKLFDTSHTLTCRQLHSGNYKFTCYNMDNLSLPTSGPLMRFTVVVAAEAGIGDSFACSLTAAEFTRTADSEGESLADVSFAIHIADPRIVLDENSTTVPEASDGEVDVRVKRTIRAGQWSTLVLPFDMTAEQVYEAFGDDVQLAEFIDYEANDDLTEIAVTFDDAYLQEDGLMANNPYIIKTSKDISEFLVDGVVVDPDEEGAVAEFTNGRTGARKEVYGSFIGLYHAGGYVPANGLFLSGGQFWYSTGKSKTKAFCGYLMLNDVLASLSDAATRVSLHFNNEESTGIVTTKKTASAHDYYDLQGRKVPRPRAKGLYVRDGRKMIVK